MRVGGSIFGVLITWSSWGVWQHSPQQEYSHGHDIVRSGRHSRLFSLHDWNLKDFFCENQTFLYIRGVDCIFVLLFWWWGNICTWWGNICTSSAMISDCSSRLKRLERRPPASTLLMYSRNPWGEKSWISSEGSDCWPPPWCPGLWRGRWFLCLKRAVLRLQGRNTEVAPVTPVVRKRFFKSSKKLVEL